MEEPQEDPWRCTAFVCVAGVHCCEILLGKQIHGK